MAYVFYDIETTGLNTRFDQVVQFAAVFTDENLRVRDTFDVKCRLRPDLIPSIDALAVNGLSLKALTNPMLPTNYEMACSVRSKLASWSPATFVGWNSIRFDEEFLRGMFYQNLHPPFLTNTRPNSRFDLMYAARAACLLEPAEMHVPTNLAGQSSFALALFAKANGLGEQVTHDALTDAKILVSVAEKLKRDASVTWSLSNRFSQKKSVLDFLETGEPAIGVNTGFGNIEHFPFVKIGENQTNTNQVIVMDLRANLEWIERMVSSDTNDWLSKEAHSIRSIKANASPMIIPFDQLDDFQDYDLDALYDRAENIRSQAELCERISEVFVRATHREYSNKYVEQKIYETPENEDRSDLLNRFHLCIWPDRIATLSECPDKRYRNLGIRIVGEHAPEQLSDKQTQRLNELSNLKKYGPNQETAPWRTINDARSELEKFRNSGRASDKQELVAEYTNYLERADTNLTKDTSTI